MIRLTLALAAFLFTTQAFAYETTQFKLLVSRESIRDEHPLPIADGGPFRVRYEGDGSCFVVGAHDDYRCDVKLYTNFESPFVLLIGMPDLASFLQKELTWTAPQFKAEFLSTLPKSGTVNFEPANEDRANPAPVNVEINRTTFRSADGKTEFHLQ